MIDNTAGGAVRISMAFSLSRIFSSEHRKTLQDTVKIKHHNLVQASRAPILYQEYGIPDNRDGRLESLYIHLFMELEQLKGKEDALAQALLTRTFFGLDDNLREMGVGDLGVGKRVKVMAEIFYGRVAQYKKLLTDPTALHQQLQENIAPTVTPALAHYIIENL